MTLTGPKRLCGKRHVFGSKKQDHHNSRCDKPHTPIDDKHRGKTDEKSFSSLKLKLKREGMTEHTKHSRVCRSKLKVNAFVITFKSNVGISFFYCHLYFVINFHMTVLFSSDLFTEKFYSNILNRK